MSELQKVNLGTPPLGRDGDSNRTAHQRFNANVDVLKAQAALSSSAAINSPGALNVADHVGRRVNINLAVAGTVSMPKVSDLVDQDSVLFLRNLGSTAVTLAAAAGTNDWVGLSRLGPGESALLDGYGGAWNVLMRGRARTDNENVLGNLAVAKDLSVSGAASFSARPTFAGSTPYDSGNLSPVDTKSDQTVGGKKDFSQRPTFAGKAAWDTGNLANPMTLDTPQNVTGRKNYTAQVAIARPAPDGSWLNAPLVISGYPGVGSIGIGSGSSAVVLRCAATYQALEVVSYDSSVFATIAASAFNVNSDAAIKTQIQTIDCATEKIKRLRGVTYVMKADKQRLSQVGVIAQEVAEAFPEAVSETGMQIDEAGVSVDRGGRPMLSVNYSALIGPLIQAFKELEARVSTLEG
ncbi:tail fiber domain-containing protein [Burkholderia stagnalis]|uniref:tail fiber domain-containing protein n=1 Tax=Burkholderia stagnalis TaxID=1503054 RepID=UPI000F5F13E8|nr:tail fiber domain-containing protein [Burkholderia stagnalis]RQY60794.1 tail fiber domain-containing protein [Burkholderia stagnalis]